MPKLKLTFSSLLILALLTGCGSANNRGSFDFAENSATPQFNAKRIIVKSANINIEVNAPDVIAEEITSLIKKEQGYIEHTYNHNQQRISMTVKIPEAKRDVFIDEVASKGKLISKSIHARDVTEQTIDIEAKLKNLTSLRENFRSLLVKAQNVSEILAIEKELSRIQSEIDSIEGRRKALNNQISFSRVEITIDQETIYGPLGYLGKGIYWFFEKLFVIK